MKLFEEQKLLYRAKEMDMEALAMIYDSLSPELFNYSMKLTGNVQVSEDCVADTFTRFLKALGQKQGPRNYLRAYLYRMAHNWIVDYYRRELTVFEMLDEHISANPASQPDHLLDTEAAQQKIRSTLWKLTEDQRQVVSLRFLEQWEFHEIAVSMNKSVGAVKALLHRGMEQLKGMLQEEAEVNNEKI